MYFPDPFDVSPGFISPDHAYSRKRAAMLWDDIQREIARIAVASEEVGCYGPGKETGYLFRRVHRQKGDHVGVRCKLIEQGPHLLLVEVEIPVP